MTRWTSIGAPVVAVRSVPTDRSFGLVVGSVLLAIGAFSYWRGHVLRAEWVGGIGLLLIVAALIRPAMLSRLAAGWGRIGHALGWFNSRVLLTLMFALILVPVGWASRLFGSNPLDRRRRSESRWSAYPDRFRDPKHVERPF